MLYLGRNEGLISLIVFGLTNMSDWHEIKTVNRCRTGLFRQVDFRASNLSRRNRKDDFVPDRNVGKQKAWQENLRLPGEHTCGRTLLTLDPHHALSADRNGRTEGGKTHTLGRQYERLFLKAQKGASNRGLTVAGRGVLAWDRGRCISESEKWINVCIFIDKRLERCKVCDQPLQDSEVRSVLTAATVHVVGKTSPLLPLTSQRPRLESLASVKEFHL